MDENTRFRRALKNPIVMAGLCVLAGIAIYFNGIEPTRESSWPNSVAATPVSVTPTSATLRSAPLAHDDVATRWTQHPTRDPFAPMHVINQSTPKTKLSKASETKSSETTASPPPRQHPQSIHNLLLKAVAIEAEQRSAVINRQVVYEGEMIEGYQVVSIQLKGVWLKRHGRKEFLTFATNSTS